jgi:2-polyprenyl-6-methoxyphenol hydroxylase-like FAD-dependent oxidoreductase
MNAPETSTNPSERHAVVLGAGIAGLVAARVLADHFDRVTVVEQDQLPAEPAPRNGVPQSRHVHVLLNSGNCILEQLFPGLQDDLARGGSPLLDGLNDLAWLTPAGWGVRYRSQYLGRSAGRPLLEWTVRQRLVRDPRVSFVEQRSAVGLRASDDASRVIGVRIRPRSRGGEDAGPEEQISAALVVDATGRGSRATTWLRELGYPEPPRTEIDAFLGYTTRFYRLPDDPTRDWQGLFLQAAVPRTLRGGLLLRLENDQWICTLGGYGKDYPPADEAGYLDYAGSLRSPMLYEAIREAEPISDIVATRSTKNVWRHYEKLSRWPEGLVAIGDAACAFNPVYGQGMSVAAKEAMVLDRLLREPRRSDGDLTGLAWRFQQAIPTTIRPVWQIATGNDVRVPGAEGGRPTRADRFIHRYLDRVIQLTTEDVFARQLFMEVLQLDQPPSRLFHPRLLAKVILGPTGRGATGPRAPAHVVPA